MVERDKCDKFLYSGGGGDFYAFVPSILYLPSPTKKSWFSPSAPTGSSAQKSFSLTQPKLNFFCITWNIYIKNSVTLCLCEGSRKNVSPLMARSLRPYPLKEETFVWPDRCCGFSYDGNIGTFVWTLSLMSFTHLYIHTLEARIL